MKRELIKQNIPFTKHEARYFTNEDYDNFDYIFYMDEENEMLLRRRFNLNNNNKIMPIYKFTPSVYEIEDPWYTSNYQKVVNQLRMCILDIIKYISR